MKKKTLILLLLVSIILVGCNNNSNNEVEKSNDYNDVRDNYVTNSKKSAFIDMASAYIDAVRMKVNEGRKLKIYSTDTLYMIPVGNNDLKSCVSVETGGKSPFNAEWKYAYVGVVYDGTGYSYYAVMEDESNHGIDILDQKALLNEGINKLYDSGNSNINFTNLLISKYNIFENDVHEMTTEEKSYYSSIINNSSISSIAYLAGGDNCKI